jgi:P27 family predicted phage terminase small subunit
MVAKKPAQLRQRSNTPDAGVLPRAPSGMVPSANDQWRAGTVERWHEFWCSPLAQQVEASDYGSLRRLWGLYDELDRLWDAVEETGRVVVGSQGQPRPNPLFKQIEAFQAEARQLEDRFGLSPLARLRLGITFADAAASLDGLNQRLAERMRQVDDGLWDEG